MATYSTGITATWGSITFGEMQSLSWSHGGGGAKGRDAPWSDEIGTVSIQCLGAAGGRTHVGSRQTLTITGGGCALTAYAVYESLSIDADLNGVTKSTVSLKILD